MKRIVILLAALLLIIVFLSSCTFEVYRCPAYSQQNKMTTHGLKAQMKYIKRKV
jgi:outer membrane lipoprotein-sorting protein